MEPLKPVVNGLNKPSAVFKPLSNLPAETDKIAGEDNVIISGGAAKPKELGGKGGAAVTAMTMGDIFLYLSDPTGLVAYSHELGHVVAFKSIYNADNVKVQIDSFDNFKNFVKDPSGQNLSRWLGGYDAGQDGAAGVTSASGFHETPLSQKLGPNASMAIISAVGQAVIETPQLAAFAAGFALRKEHPVIGYTLMASSTWNHFLNTYYPLSAALMPKNQLAEAAHQGHDFASFAVNTGINPWVTAGVFAALLPVEAAALVLLDKMDEDKVKDQLSLSRLIQKGKITEAQITEAYNKYPEKESLSKTEKKFSSLLATPLSELNEKSPAEVKKAMAELQGKYSGFRDYLVKQYRPQIETEKKNLPPEKHLSFKETIEKFKNDFKEQFKKDKIGTALDVGAISGGVALAGRGALEITKAVAKSPALLSAASVASQALKALVPGIGAVAVANSAYHAYKAVSNPELSGKEKAFQLSLAGFSALVAAALFVPAAAPFLAIGGIVGTVGTLAAKWISQKLSRG